jgi:23S rRNA (uracil1939-C5)-methyltransferase
LTSKKAPTPNPAVRLGQEVELEFNDLLSNGQAVGRWAGMAVFVFGPLPRERARVRITALKPKYAVGTVVDLLERCAERADPFCPVFGTCGGCQVQHLRYADQLAWKQTVVRNALQRIGGIAEPVVAATIGMMLPRQYRNKMALVVDDSAASSGFGFYKQRSHDVVPIDRCPIVQPRLDDYIQRLSALRRDARTATAFSGARHVVARTARSSGESVVTITRTHRKPMPPEVAQDVLRALPGAAGITQSFDLSSDNAILGRKHELLAGRGTVEEVVGGIRFRISPGSFFQVNVEIVERIFEFLQPLLETPRRIVDLYCGSGTFALFFAKAGCDVLGVEESASAVEEARENARLNGLGARAEFRRGQVHEVLQEAATERRLREADAVFLDPPRKGSDPQTLAAVAGAALRDVWYLSCDPATLARDLKFLVAKGYRVSNVQPFDMFPQTGHVESLAILSRTEN